MATVRVEFCSADDGFGIVDEVLAVDTLSTTSPTADVSIVAPADCEVALIRVTAGDAYIAVGESGLTINGSTNGMLRSSSDSVTTLLCRPGDYVHALET